MRLAVDSAIIPLYEAGDLAAGADSDSFQFSQASDCDIILLTGVLTVPGALSVFSGATVGAKTTALPFTYRMSSGDFKATGADQYGAEVVEADGVFTLVAATHDHRAFVLHIDAADLPEGHSWVTLALASGTAQNVAAVAILRGTRYQPPVTLI